MSMPRFTAENALYQTSGQYRTSRQIIYSPLRPVSSIYPAVLPAEVPIDVPGEIIVVHGEAPPCPLGWINVGGTCVLEGPSSGGGPGTVGEPGGDAGDGPGGGVGGGFGKPPKVHPLDTPLERKLKGRRCTAKEVGGDIMDADLRCQKRGNVNAGVWAFTRCYPQRDGTVDVMCCTIKADGTNKDCIPLSEVPA
jgi:hypothetical protein